MSEGWRRRPDLNRGWRFCRPLPYHLATAPDGACAGKPETYGPAVRLKAAVSLWADNSAGRDRKAGNNSDSSA